MSWSAPRLPALLLAASLPCGVLADEPTPVQTRSFEELAVERSRSAPAEVISLNRAVISAEINAPVRRLAVRVGDRVKTGQTLAELDCRDYQIERRAAEAALERLASQLQLAESQLARVRRLAAERNVSEEELDRSESELAVRRAQRSELEAALAGAERQVEKCRLAAPFDAVIVGREAQIGELATPGKAMFELIDIDSVEVSARVRPADLEGLLRAEQAWFEVAGRRSPLRLRAVVPAADPRSRDQELRLAFTDGRAIPGLSGRLGWQLPGRFLPATLVVQRDGRYGVFLVNDGAAHFRPLAEAQEGRDPRADLEPGARVVVTGQLGLIDGQTVSEERR